MVAFYKEEHYMFKVAEEKSDPKKIRKAIKNYLNSDSYSRYRWGEEKYFWNSMFEHAIKNKNTAVIYCLLDMGLKPDIEVSGGWSLFDMARKIENDGLRNLLLKAIIERMSETKKRLETKRKKIKKTVNGQLENYFLKIYSKEIDHINETIDHINETIIDISTIIKNNVSEGEVVKNQELRDIINGGKKEKLKVFLSSSKGLDAFEKTFGYVTSDNSKTNITLLKIKNLPVSQKVRVELMKFFLKKQKELYIKASNNIKEINEVIKESKKNKWLLNQLELNKNYQRDIKSNGSAIKNTLEKEKVSSWENSNKELKNHKIRKICKNIYSSQTFSKTEKLISLRRLLEKIYYQDQKEKYKVGRIKKLIEQVGNSFGKEISNKLSFDLLCLEYNYLEGQRNALVSTNNKNESNFASKQNLIKLSSLKSDLEELTQNNKYNLSII